ncbi:MAG: GNAT family N-acetyltransferase [Spirochaetaceae bacterium]|nr:GNAT family N-acetyltransferase [Spirochaetaceae bacterium]
MELEILKETFQSWKARPGDPFTILELRDGRLLAGFAVFTRAQNTDFTFDIVAICVDQGYHGKGVGERLVEMIEEEARRIAGSAIVRIETSLRKEEAADSGLFASSGYALLGHIVDFYGEGNDYFMYARYLGADRAEAPGDSPAAAVAAAAAAPGRSSTTEGGKR